MFHTDIMTISIVYINYITSKIELLVHKRYRTNSISKGVDPMDSNLLPLTHDFIELLLKTPDDRTGIYKTMDFLSLVLKYKSSTPPSTEYITIIKHKKPIMFQHLKRAISPSSPLQYILLLEMNYNLALERLGIDEPVLG